MFEVRPATDADYDFLFALLVATMREYVAATWGWDDKFQAERFKHSFDANRWQIVLVEGRQAGAFALRRNAEEYFLANLYISPEYQGHGIGTKIIRRIIAEARERGLPVTLNVLKSNFRARALYERLGFRVSGETEGKFYMTTAHERAI